MRTQEVLQKIRTNRPTSLNEFNKLGLLGRYVGKGVFRESFKIRGTNLIVKFPLNEARHDCTPVYKSGIAHSRTEMRRWTKLKKIKALRAHLPKVWYYDKTYGIVVMTHYIKFGGYGWDKIGMMGKVINKLIKQYAHTAMNDIQEDNMRMTAEADNKRIVFVDLGY